MATIQRRLGEYEAGLVTVYIEYDDQLMRISGVRVINNGLLDCYAYLVRQNDNQKYDYVFPPGDTYIPIPTQGPTRIDFIDNGHGKWANVEIHCCYPWWI